MRYSWILAASCLAACLVCASPKAQAQVSVQIGPAPICPYGYFDYPPYACAPYGYYGPEWFENGVFIGAGPWFHGHRGWHGHVDNHFDPHHGYHGPLPHAGEHGMAHPHPSFHGNEMRDGRGHAVDEHGHPR